MLNLQSIQNLYDNKKIPANYELLEKLLNLYLSIPRTEIEKSSISHRMYLNLNMPVEKHIRNELERQEQEFWEELSQDEKDSHVLANNFRFGNAPGWIGVHSWDFLRTEKIKQGDLAHRFYIGVNEKDLITFVNALYDKFKEANIPFYFKYDNSYKRQDQVVIYATTKDLKETLEVLDAMRRDYPEIFQRCEAPTILMGKLDDKIGYASEEDRKGKSYTSNICSSFAESITEVINKYIKDNPNLDVTSEGKHMSIKDYYDQNPQKSAEGDLVRYFLRYGPNFKRDLFNIFLKNLSNNGVNLDNIFVSNKVEKETRMLIAGNYEPEKKFNFTFEEVKKLYDNYYLDQTSDGKWVAVDRKDNKICNIPGWVELLKFANTWVAATMNERSRPTFETNVVTDYDYDYAFGDGAKEVYNFMMYYLTYFNTKHGGVNRNPTTQKIEYIPQKEELEQYIKDLSKQGIILSHADCIIRGLYTKDRYKDSLEAWAKMVYDNYSLAELQDRINLPKKFDKTDDAKKQIDDLVTNKTFTALDAKSFTKIINPELLKGKMKLPNGIEIPTKQYLEEVVFAHLPSNGVVTLANGYLMPVKQFIEENVMFECQRDYNGDFIKYLAEKTRNNSGTVTCDFNGAKYEIMPTDITRFLNPVLLGQSIKLPNGKEISAREYIKDYYAPYIPRNGMVTLTNGNVIPVQEFIEKTLLSEENTKYNGDINQILYYTTRNNNGVINGDLEEIKEEIQKMKNEVVREPIKQQQKVEKPETPKKDPLKPMDTKKQENDQERELLLQLQREEIMRIMNEAPLKEKEEEKREKQRKLIDDLMQDAKREVSPEERKKALEELRQRMLQQKKEGYVLSDNFAQGLEGNIHEHSRGR